LDQSPKVHLFERAVAVPDKDDAAIVDPLLKKQLVREGTSHKLCRGNPESFSERLNPAQVFSRYVKGDESASVGPVMSNGVTPNVLLHRTRIREFGGARAPRVTWRY
jgi:hypothetical protein